jgi:hypothetical protein
VNDAATSSSSPRLVQFPNAARVERDGLLGIARSVVPLLAAALEEGNAELVRQVFGVLGEVAEGGDAAARLAGIRLGDAEVVQLGAGGRRARREGGTT